LNRALAELGKTLANPSLVLALFVRQLGGSNTLVGLLSTIRYGGWFLPQLFVAGRIQNEPRKSSYYVKAELTRCAGYALIALAILAMPRADLLLPVFFVLFPGLLRDPFQSLLGSPEPSAREPSHTPVVSGCGAGRPGSRLANRRAGCAGRIRVAAGEYAAWLWVCARLSADGRS
jgi:hypothetical protein